MNKQNKDSNSNKKRGNRLKECREYRNLTQEKIAELANVSVNYISMLENGKRKITWDKAVSYGNILKTNPSFIMCESDIIEPDTTYNILDADSFGRSDLLLLNLLIAIGYDIIFSVIKIYDKEEQPKEKEWKGNSYLDYDSIKHKVKIDSLAKFSFSDYHCLMKENDILSEGIITDVSINDTTMTYGEFCYFVNRLYDYIHFMFNHISEAHSDLLNQKYGTDSALRCEVEELKASYRTDLKNQIIAEIGKYQGSFKTPSGDVISEKEMLELLEIDLKKQFPNAEIIKTTE